MSRKPGNSSHTALKELEQRKKLIEAELNQIQDELEDSVDYWKESILSTVVPRNAIRKKPFKSVGIALLTGFIAGLPRLTGGASRSDKRIGGPGIPTLILDELKRIAARRAVQFFVETFDSKVSNRTADDEQDPESPGS